MISLEARHAGLVAYWEAKAKAKAGSRGAVDRNKKSRKVDGTGLAVVHEHEEIIFAWMSKEEQEVEDERGRGDGQEEEQQADGDGLSSSAATVVTATTAATFRKEFEDEGESGGGGYGDGRGYECEDDEDYDQDAVELLSADVVVRGGDDRAKSDDDEDDDPLSATTTVSVYENRIQNEPELVCFRRAIMSPASRARVFRRWRAVLDDTHTLGVVGRFAARAGVGRVFVVADTPSEARKVGQVAHDNGDGDVVSAVLLGGGGDAVADDVSLPTDTGRVQVLLSSWLGECVFSRSGFVRFLKLRDRFLAPDGIIMPDEITLHLCAVSDSRGRFGALDFWRNPIYGLDLGCVREVALRDAEHRYVTCRRLPTGSCQLRSFDLYRVGAREADLRTEASFSLEVRESCELDGFLLFFCCEMSEPGGKRCAFTNSPEAYKPTSYMQTVLYFDEPIRAAAGDAIRGTFTMSFGDYEEASDMAVTVRWSLSSVQEHCWGWRGGGGAPPPERKRWEQRFKFD